MFTILTINIRFTFLKNIPLETFKKRCDSFLIIMTKVTQDKTVHNIGISEYIKVQ